tara:strand:- start:546 stop:1184 length:639 start_codon:yes stop_codon:yes gene_type:complete
MEGGKGQSVLKARIREAERKGLLCPPMADMWRALECTPPEEVKVVLLGQDPYHGMRQAHGLAFSVADPLLSWPPSLRNVFKERASDLDVPLDRPANLEDWAQQGVLLLNAVLTTEMGTAGAHQGLGWEKAVHDLLVALMARTPSLVWILWGKPAQHTHARAVEAHGAVRPGDTVIASAHPSPIAAYRGFWDSQPFSRCNAALEARGAKSIVW